MDEDLERRFEGLEVRFVELREHMDATAEEMRRYFNAAVERLSAENRSYAEKVTADTRHYFDIVAEDLKRQIQLVAEGRSTTEQRLTREVVRLDERIDAGTEEATALRFAHNKLDARVGVLEEKKRTRR